jgi:hypothetical protein
VLTAGAVTMLYATFPSTIVSSTPVTVTILGVRALAGVNESVVGETVPSFGLELDRPIETVADGMLVSATLKVAVPPPSVVTRPVVGVTLKPVGPLTVAQAENSEVEPVGLVAVVVMIVPSGKTLGACKLKLVLPKMSVVPVFAKPRNVSSSPKPEASQRTSLYASIRYGPVDGTLLRVRAMVVLPPLVIAEPMTGKF